jgi:hypothetical protein
VLSEQKDEAIGRYLQRLKSKHDTAGALGHKPGRAVY